MVQQPILENKSLNFIINSINMGLVDFESLEDLCIVSSNHEDFFVKVFEIDLQDKLVEFLSKNPFGLKDKLKSLETILYDYVMFTVKDGILINMPIAELLISDKLIADESGTIVKNIDLFKEEWTLTEIK